MKSFFILFLTIPFLAYGQDAGNGYAPYGYTSPTVWRLDFLGPGVIHEMPLESKLTLASGARLVGNSSVGSAEGPGIFRYRTWSYAVYPELYSGVRYFYNFQKRLDQGRSIRANSGNYVSLRARAILPALARHIDYNAPLREYGGFSVDALWGIQRTYRKNFYLHLALGFSLRKLGRLDGASEFTVGYTLPNRR